MFLLSSYTLQKPTRSQKEILPSFRHFQNENKEITEDLNQNAILNPLGQERSSPTPG